MPETLDDPKLEMERQKLEIESQKLAIERQKLNLETTKAKWATVSIGVPILAVTLTIIWGLVASQTQARQALRLEAMKTIMATDIFDMQVSRATFLRDFFKTDLGEDFLKDLDRFRTPDGPDVLAKVRFLDTVASRGLNPEETAKLVQILFPAHKWAALPDVLAILSAASKRTPEK
jgi:hypothetical protein